jgi:hypothetical protein
MKRDDLYSMKYVELYLVADYAEVRGGGVLAGSLFFLFCF